MEIINFQETNVEYKILSEVIELKRGKRLVKNQLTSEGKYAVYQNSMIPLGYYVEYNFSKDTTFIISAGSAGEIGYSDSDFWAADDVFILETPENILSKFLFYVLLQQEKKIKSKVRKASIPRLSRRAVEKIEIPIPSLTVQEKIIEILDRFDVLTNNISEGLPKEIELRQKQYEYYREKLLTFKERPSDGRIE